MPMSREQLLQVQASARIFQARADDAFAPWGMRAPAPVVGEPVNDYRRKLMILAKNQLPEGHQLRGVTVKRIPNDALDNFEKMYMKNKRLPSISPSKIRSISTPVVTRVIGEPSLSGSRIRSWRSPDIEEQHRLWLNAKKEETFWNLRIRNRP